MKLVVATPAYGEIVYTPYVSSLLRLQRALHKRGDQMQHIAVSYAEVSEARNFLLTYWFDKTDASHLLFVDADMGFEPQFVTGMLAFNKPVVGVVAPRRQVDLTRIAQAAARGAKPAEAIARGHDFVVRPLPADAGDQRFRRQHVAARVDRDDPRVQRRQRLVLEAEHRPGHADQRQHHAGGDAEQPVQLEQHVARRQAAEAVAHASAQRRSRLW